MRREKIIIFVLVVNREGAISSLEVVGSESMSGGECGDVLISLTGSDLASSQ